MTQERQTYGYESDEPLPWTIADQTDGDRVVQQYQQEPGNSLEASMKWAVRAILIGPGLSLALVLGFAVFFLLFIQTAAGADVYSSEFNTVMGLGLLALLIATIANLAGLVFAVLGVIAFVKDYRAGISRPFAMVLLAVTLLWELRIMTLISPGIMYFV